MEHVLARLHAGAPVVIDDALGAWLGHSVLNDTKRLLAANRLLNSDELAELVHGLKALVGHADGSWFEGRETMHDSARLIAWLHEGRDTPGITVAIRALRRVARAIGEAETRLSSPLSPAWPAVGLYEDPRGVLLQVSGFNRTRCMLTQGSNPGLAEWSNAEIQVFAPHANRWAPFRRCCQG
tara:strand:+ start:1567 stop:2112 length:546 start_codon:yes stop_codon:yes gene_type:complete